MWGKHAGAEEIGDGGRREKEGGREMLEEDMQHNPESTGLLPQSDTTDEGNNSIFSPQL